MGTSFWSNSPVHTALIGGGVVAVVCGLVGVLTVIRGQSFAGHAVSDMDTTGGSAAALAGVNPLWGFVILGMAAAGGMELIGVRRLRGRDVATGIVLGAALGLSALFLYLQTSGSSTTGTTVNVLFGSIWTMDSSTVPAMAVMSGAGVVAVLVLYRPLLLSAISEEMAYAAGVAVRAVAFAFLVLMAVSVSLASVAVGSILSTALLVGPAAAALRVTRSPGKAMLSSAAIALACTWLGVYLSWESYYWPPSKGNWPVSFFIVTLVFVSYLAAGLLKQASERRSAPRATLPDALAAETR